MDTADELQHQRVTEPLFQLALSVVGVSWQLDRYWDLGLIYRYFEGTAETDEFENDVRYNQALLQLTRWW